MWKSRYCGISTRIDRDNAKDHSPLLYKATLHSSSPPCRALTALHPRRRFSPSAAARPCRRSASVSS